MYNFFQSYTKYKIMNSEERVLPEIHQQFPSTALILGQFSVHVSFLHSSVDLAEIIIPGAPGSPYWRIPQDFPPTCGRRNQDRV